MKNVLFIFGQLRDTDVEWMADHGAPEEVRRGQTLIREGESIEDVYLTLTGEFVVGREREELARIGPGEMVGEMSFLEASLPSADVRAAVEGRVLRLPRVALQRRLDSDPEFAARFYRGIALTLSARLRDADAGLARRPHREGVLEPDELDPTVMESLTRAGERFDRLVRQVVG